MSDPVSAYARDVLDGKVTAGRLVRWACERHFRDLAQQGTDEFPWIFDPSKAARIIEFFRYCRHVEGPLARQPIELMPWQQFVMGSIFGWVHPETKLRRFRVAYEQVARGNGKSLQLSGVGLYMLMADGEFGAKVYATATMADQARIVYDAARVMATLSPDLLRRLEPGRAAILHPASESLFLPLSRETKSLDGLNPHLGIVDEYHAHPTREMYDLLVSAMGKRSQPLLFIITTAGYDLTSPCYEEYTYCVKLLRGDLRNDRYFAYVAQLDPEDNPQDETVWIKANPLVASTEAGMEYLREELRTSLDVPSKMRSFLTKNLNMWVDQREEGYMPMDRWRACKGELPDLSGRTVWVGVDLGSKIDLCSVGVEVPLDDGRVALLSHSFMPRDAVAARLKTDRQPYDLWIRQGWITETPGAVVDQETVVNWIETEVRRRGWKVAEVCVDPWNASQFAIEMQRRGFLVVEITQGTRTLSGPTKDFRERVLAGRVVHDGNPVLDWAMACAVERRDHNENIMLDKAKSTARIDPVVALLNAHARAMHATAGRIDAAQYATREFLDRLWGR